MSKLREAAQEALIAIEAFTDPEDCMPEDTGEFRELARVMIQLRAALAEPITGPSAKHDQWKQAVLDQTIVAHIYHAEHEDNPRQAIQDIINWNCSVALDPLVSSDAEALVQRGRDEQDAKLRAALEQLLAKCADDGRWLDKRWIKEMDDANAAIEAASTK